MLLHVYKPIISGFTALCALEIFVGVRLHAYKGMSTDFNHTYAMVIFLYDNVSIIYRLHLYYDQHFIFARLDGESRHVKIEKLILILATFIV